MHKFLSPVSEPVYLVDVNCFKPPGEVLTKIFSTASYLVFLTVLLIIPAEDLKVTHDAVLEAWSNHKVGPGRGAGVGITHHTTLGKTFCTCA
jgi:hypothetical protein